MGTGWFEEKGRKSEVQSRRRKCGRCEKYSGQVDGARRIARLVVHKEKLTLSNM